MSSTNRGSSSFRVEGYLCTLFNWYLITCVDLMLHQPCSTQVSLRPWEQRLVAFQHSAECLLCTELPFRITYQGLQHSTHGLPRFVCFVCGISLTSSQFIIELFPNCLIIMLFTLFLCRLGSERVYKMTCLFVTVGPNALFIVLSHWNNMS